MKIFFSTFIIWFCFQNILIAQNWNIETSPTKQNFARLDMINEQLGWAVTYDRLIINYNGTEWSISDTLQINSGVNLLDSLTSESYEIGDIYTIRMIDPLNGWIAVNNAYSRNYSLFKYQNGVWNHWPKTFPVKFRALDFINENVGIAVGENGGFSFLNNQWKLLQLPSNTDLRAVSYVSSDKIFACGEKGTVLQKTDKWKIMESPTNYLLRDMKFISDDEGWFVGKNGVILHYYLGNITKEISPTKVNLWAVDFIDKNFGYAVGEQGIILKYDGINWNKITSPTNADLHDIELLDKKNGWIVGAWGTILSLNKSESIVSNKEHKFLFTDQVHLGSSNLMDRIDDVWGVSVADFNDDNLEDIYFTCYRSLNHLLLNQGSGYYLDYTIESGAGGTIESRLGKQKYEFGSLIADYDRDGDSDIFLIGLYGTTRLLLNNGQAQFEDITSVSNLPQDLNIQSGSIGDFNEDGYVDLALVDEKKGLRIILNEKYNNFSEQNIDSLSFNSIGLKAISISDINYDNHSDLILFSTTADPIILLNDGNCNWKKVNDILISDRSMNIVNSTSIADFNNDGHQDIFVCTENGKDAILINQYPELKFKDESEKWKIKQSGRSYSAVPGDFDNNGDIDIFVSRYGNDYLYLNENGTHFKEISSKIVYSKAGFLSGFNIGAASIDIDHDGDLDLIVGNRNHWSSLLQNNQNNSSFIKIEVNGLYDTNEGLGTKVWVYSSDSLNNSSNLLAYREINPCFGQTSQRTNMVHIGLGTATKADITVRFLNGEEFLIDAVKKGSTIQVNQSNFFISFIYKVGRTILQYMHIPAVPFETFKFIIFIFALLLSVKLIEKRYDWRHSHTAIYILGATIVYLSLTFPFLNDQGFFIHFLPFLVIAFVILLLISVNENIRKNNLREKQIQIKLQESGTQLSKNIDINTAIGIATKTIRFLYPYKYLAVYLYYQFGNYFICHKSEKIKIKDSDHFISISRDSINKLLRMKSPLLLKNLNSLFPSHNIFKEDSLVFPMIKKQEIQGFIILGKSESQNIIDDYTLNNLKYLVMQLANTLSNLQILDKMQDQQQLFAIGTFSSSILHNLKNPVDGLRMITEVLLNETNKDDDNREYIEELYEGILKLKKDLLNSFDFKKDNLNTSNEINIENVLNDIKTNYEKLEYPAIQLDIQKNLGIINGNSQQISQALENLIENAMEASNYSRPVKISASKPENGVCINIQDYGDGIPIDKINKLFNMFYSTKGEGRGLGLTISRNIIERHKGFLDLKISKNEGTTFTVILPINQN